MNKITPPPQDKIGECFIWREWLVNLFSNLSPGASGTYTTADGKTVTVVNGIITKIV